MTKSKLVEWENKEKGNKHIDQISIGKIWNKFKNLWSAGKQANGLSEIVLILL